MLSLFQDIPCKTFVILPGAGGRMGMVNCTSPFLPDLDYVGYYGNLFV